MKTKLLNLLTGLLLGIVVATSYFVVMNDRCTKNDASPLSEAIVVAFSTMPTINLHTEYFNREKLESASGTNKTYINSDAKLERAVFSDGYRSFPTTTIAFIDYSNEHAPLSELPTNLDWDMIIKSSDQFKDTYIERVAKYGDLAKKYSVQGRQRKVIEADVTGDGIK